MARSFLASLVLALASCVVLAGAVRAQTSDDEQAHVHFQVAASYYEQANYESALREFLEAYRLSHRSQLYYNLSLCYQQLGDLANAVDYLDRYLREITDIPNRASLETRLENLRARLAAQQAGTPPPPDTTGTETTTTTVETSTETTEGTETSTTSTTSTTSSASSSGGGGDSLNVGAIVGFSVAGLGLILGATFTGLAASENGSISGMPCATTRTCTDSQLSGMRTDALVADVMWGVSLVGAAAGLVLLLVNPGGGGGSSDAHASLRLVPGGLSLEGTF